MVFLIPFRFSSIYETSTSGLANAAEVDKGGRKMAQGKADKKPFKGYTPKSPFNKGGMAKKKAKK